MEEWVAKDGSNAEFWMPVPISHHRRREWKREVDVLFVFRINPTAFRTADRF